MEKIIRATKKDNSRRRWPHESGPRPDKAADKRGQAQARQEAWTALSPAQQLADLDRRLGKGEGAKKQRARLQAQVKA